MSLQAIQLEKITEADLARLVADGTPENQTTEYKRDWTAASDDGKKEFLADVASFANTNGGDIIYGVEEDKGVPKQLVGLSGFVFDEERLRAENMLRDLTERRIVGVGFRTIPLASGVSVLVVRIPKSWSGPHRVNFRGLNRFYARNPGGRFEFDVAQLADAFGATERIYERMKDFRLDRVSRIANGNVEVSLITDYRIALHVMPLAQLASYDPRELHSLMQLGLTPIGSVSSMGPQIHFESFMVTATNDGKSYSYVQLFRSGFLEAVMCSSGGQTGKVMSPGYEQLVSDRLRDYCRVLLKLGIRPPYVVGLSHINVAGFTIYTGSPFDQPRVNERQNLVVPEKILEAVDSDSIDQFLPALFDPVWQAFGFFGSPNKRDGKWTARTSA